jgi:hypothetical protein
MFGLPLFFPEQGGTAILAGVAGALIVLLWWTFFSRAPWFERIAAVAIMVGAVALTSRLVHESIANGMMGFMLYVYAAPVLTLALVAWAAASRRFSTPARRASMAGALLLGCGALTLVRTDGITGDAIADFEWRWTPTAEQRLLAGAVENPSPSRPATGDAAPGTVPPSVESTVIPAQPSAAITDAAPPLSDRGRMGPASVARPETASFAARGSKPTGPATRRRSFGGVRLGQGGRRSPSQAIGCSRRNNAAKTKSYRRTT